LEMMNGWTLLLLVAAFVGGAFLGRHVTGQMDKGRGECATSAPAVRGDTKDQQGAKVTSPNVGKEPKGKADDGFGAERTAFLAALGYDMRGQRKKGGDVFASKKVASLPTIGGQTPTLERLVRVFSCLFVVRSDVVLSPCCRLALASHIPWLVFSWLTITGWQTCSAFFRVKG
jgi:hypothetical protein